MGYYCVRWFSNVLWLQECDRVYMNKSVCQQQTVTVSRLVINFMDTRFMYNKLVWIIRAREKRILRSGKNAKNLSSRAYSYLQTYIILQGVHKSKWTHWNIDSDKNEWSRDCPINVVAAFYYEAFETCFNVNYISYFCVRSVVLWYKRCSTSTTLYNVYSLLVYYNNFDLYFFFF